MVKALPFKNEELGIEFGSLDPEPKSVPSTSGDCLPFKSEKDETGVLWGQAG